MRGFVGSVCLAFSCYQSFLNTHLAPAFDAFLFTRLIAVVAVGECLVCILRTLDHISPSFSCYDGGVLGRFRCVCAMQ